MTNILNLLDVALIHSILRFTTPVLYAALGGLLCSRVGVFNIALEGMMLVGAFTAVVGSYYVQSPLIGVLLGAISGGLFGVLLALFVVYFRGNEVVVGIALNILAGAVTSFGLEALFGMKGSFVDPKILGLPIIDIPIVQKIPILGPFLSGHSWLILFSLLAVILLYVLLFIHTIGLRIRGVGEKPEAASTLGIKVSRVKTFVLILSGILCGLGGAQLSLGNVIGFTINMSAGRGWIAIVAVMLGNSHPFGVFSASMLFGFLDSLGLRLQSIGLPSEITGMLPYLITLVAALTMGWQRSQKTYARMPRN